MKPYNNIKLTHVNDSKSRDLSAQNESMANLLNPRIKEIKLNNKTDTLSLTGTFAHLR